MLKAPFKRGLDGADSFPAMHHGRNYSFSSGANQMPFGRLLDRLNSESAEAQNGYRTFGDPSARGVGSVRNPGTVRGTQGLPRLWTKRTWAPIICPGGRRPIVVRRPSSTLKVPHDRRSDRNSCYPPAPEKGQTPMQQTEGQATARRSSPRLANHSTSGFCRFCPG